MTLTFKHAASTTANKCCKTYCRHCKIKHMSDQSFCCDQKNNNKKTKKRKKKKKKRKTFQICFCVTCEGCLLSWFLFRHGNFGCRGITFSFQPASSRTFHFGGSVSRLTETEKADWLMGQWWLDYSLADWLMGQWRLDYSLADWLIGQWRLDYSLADWLMGQWWLDYSLAAKKANEGVTCTQYEKEPCSTIFLTIYHMKFKSDVFLYYFTHNCKTVQRNYNGWHLCIHRHHYQPNKANSHTWHVNEQLMEMDATQTASTNEHNKKEEEV